MDVLSLCKAYYELKSMQGLLEAFTTIIFERQVLSWRKREVSFSCENKQESLKLLQLGTPHETTSIQRCPWRGWRLRP